MYRVVRLKKKDVFTGGMVCCCAQEGSSFARWIGQRGDGKRRREDV
jgi:hypothetical protein